MFFTVTILVIVSSISFYLIRKEAFHALQQKLLQQVNDRLIFLQVTAGQFIELGMYSRLNQLIASMAAEPDLDLILVVNQSGKIIASNRQQDVGSRINETDKLFQQSLNELSQRGSSLVVKQYDEHIDGYTRICTSSGESLLREAQCGFALYRLRLDYHYQLTEKLLLKQAAYFAAGVLLTAVMIMLLLEIVINRPAGKIVAVLNAFIRGQRSSRIPVAGNDEIASVGRSINTVLDEVVENMLKLESNQERLRAVFETITDAIITINKHGVIESINPAVEKHLGYRAEELIGQNVKMIMPQEHQLRHDGYIETYLQTGRKNVIGSQREVTAITRSGNEVPVELSVTRMMIQGEIYFTGVLRDISERVALREAMQQINQELFSSNIELKNRNRMDPLTGVYNRGYFDEAINREIHRAVRQQNPVSLLMLDVDHFKLYNDHYGHQQGDVCLQQVASIMQQCFMRMGEVVARYGGEEFCAIIPGADINDAVAMAERLRKAIWEKGLPHAASTTAQWVTVSIGVACLQTRGEAIVEARVLINAADEALYQAKAAGRNRLESTSLSN